MLGCKGSLIKFKKIEIILSIFSDHNHMKLGINESKNLKNHENMEIKNTLVNNQQIKEEIKGEIKTYLWKNKYGKTIYQNL